MAVKCDYQKLLETTPITMWTHKRHLRKINSKKNPNFYKNKRKRK